MIPFSKKDFLSILNTIFLEQIASIQVEPNILSGRYIAYGPDRVFALDTTERIFKGKDVHGNVIKPFFITFVVDICTRKIKDFLITTKDPDVFELMKLLKRVRLNVKATSFILHLDKAKVHRNSLLKKFCAKKNIFLSWSNYSFANQIAENLNKLFWFYLSKCRVFGYGGIKYSKLPFHLRVPLAIFVVNLINNKKTFFSMVIPYGCSRTLIHLAHLRFVDLGDNILLGASHSMEGDFILNFQKVSWIHFCLLEDMLKIFENDKSAYLKYIFNPININILAETQMLNFSVLSEIESRIHLHKYWLFELCRMEFPLAYSRVLTDLQDSKFEVLYISTDLQQKVLKEICINFELYITKNKKHMQNMESDFINLKSKMILESCDFTDETGTVIEISDTVSESSQEFYCKEKNYYLED